MNKQRLRAHATLSFLTVFLLLWINCIQEKPGEDTRSINLEDSKKKNKIILKIEDTSYINSDFEKYVRDIAGNNLNELTILSLSRLYDKFVEEMILLQAAKNQNVTLTWEEKKKFLAKLSNEYQSEEEKESLEELDTQILFDKLLIEKYTYQFVKNIEVKEEEIEEYYNLHQEEFSQPERVRISQILKKTEEGAIEVLEKIKKSSPEEFKKIAQTNSISPEASKGGDMGWFELGQLPSEIEEVIFSLKVGEVSQVVASSYGYHIFRVDKKFGPELISLEKASASVKLILLDQKIKNAISQHLEELRKNMDWKSYHQNLPFTYQGKVS